MTDLHATYAPVADALQPYRLEPVGLDDWPAMRDMLVRGYPHTPEALWDGAIRRLQAVPPAPRSEPLGVLMQGPDGTAGVSLFLGSARAAPGGPLSLNTSSWAILPQARERAMWMARHAMADLGTVYTSLTPITSTERILQRIGFRVVSHQVVVVLTPRMARQPSSPTRVLDATETLAELRDHPLAPALEDHHRLDCMVCSVETGNGFVPLVFRRWRHARFVPVAELLYAPSQAIVAENVVPLARHFLRRGFPLFEFEAHENLPIDFSSTRLFRRRWARGPYADRGTNHLYSELVYIHR